MKCASNAEASTVFLFVYHISDAEDTSEHCDVYHCIKSMVLDQLLDRYVSAYTVVVHTFALHVFKLIYLRIMVPFVFLCICMFKG